MKIELDLKKNIFKNAQQYFEKSKKAKNKLPKLEKAIKEMQERIELIKREKSFQEKAASAPSKKRKKQWFEKFRWFVSSDGLLVLAGRDAQSNELLLKRHMQEEDIYFHAEIHGSPHCIIKAKENTAPKETLEEAARFVAALSKAWNEGLSSVDVYSTLPSQISKKAPSGESIGKGAFMVYGKREWFKHTPLDFCVGVKKENNELVVIYGPENAVKKQALVYFKIVQGKEKKGETAKNLKALFLKKLNTGEEIDLDEIISALPAGGTKVA